MFTEGTTHLAVGCVDLGSLLACVLVPGEQPGPLRWVGVDSQPFCVAKTRVVLEMLLADAKVNDILQVRIPPPFPPPAFRAAHAELYVYNYNYHEIYDY